MAFAVEVLSIHSFAAIVVSRRCNPGERNLLLVSIEDSTILPEMILVHNSGTTTETNKRTDQGNSDTEHDDHTCWDGVDD